MTTLTTLHARGAGFLATQYLHQNGIDSIYPAALYTEIHFGSTPKGRRQSLDRAIETGWLARASGGSIHLGAPAIAYFGQGESEPVKFTGQKATSRASSAYDRPSLSRKYLTNSRGTRDDVPEFSVRVGAHFHTQA